MTGISKPNKLLLCNTFFNSWFDYP